MTGEVPTRTHRDPGVMAQGIAGTHEGRARRGFVRSPRTPHSSRGFTLVELLLAVAIAGVLMAALSGLVGQVLQSRAAVQARNDALREGRFAMERMVSAVRGTTRLLVPLAENPATAWSESVRAPGVLAVALPTSIDRDQDGFADADNDQDGLVDEDVGADANNDLAAGIVGIDDDGDGQTDESNKEDDDEDEDDRATKDEDPWNGLDDDGDGAIDEDAGADQNGDGASGLLGVDDDGDGDVDESNKEDDDEDEDDLGTKDEDWIDTVVFHLVGTDLMERMPNLNPVDGTDYAEHPIAENVTFFRVERVPGARAALVDLTLTVTDPGGESVTLNTRVRVGGGQ